MLGLLPRKIEFHQCLWILGSVGEVFEVLSLDDFGPTGELWSSVVVPPHETLEIFKNLFLCKLPIKNCIKWNQWLKVNCGIIKFVKSQTFFRIEITNDSWELIISILDSYHVDFLPISRRNFRSEIGLENSSKNQVVEKFLDIFRFFSIFSDQEWGEILEKFSAEFHENQFFSIFPDIGSCSWIFNPINKYLKRSD